MDELFPTLEPGDHLLYGRTPGLDLIGYTICLKTWSDACHIEIYVGDNASVASRNGLGVNLYSLRRGQLIHVLRPRRKMNLPVAMEWFHREAQGQGYDWIGLLNFEPIFGPLPASRGKMFCSELAVWFDRKAQLHPFAPAFPANRIAPANFLMSAAFNPVWSKGGKPGRL